MIRGFALESETITQRKESTFAVERSDLGDLFSAGVVSMSVWDHRSGKHTLKRSAAPLV